MQKGLVWTGLLAAVLSGHGTLEAAEPGAKGSTKMMLNIHKSVFGQLPNGTEVELYTLTNASGLKAKIMTLGTLLTELHVPDRAGKSGDVVLGFDTLEDYLKGHPFFGCVVGRYANRIAGGQFTLDGKVYKLFVNNGPNSLHGGKEGFDKKIWLARPKQAKDAVAVRFTYTSPDGEEGYPGTLKAAVTFTLTNKNELRLDYEATTDKPTPINLTNHTYFNLSGQVGTNILGHELTLAAGQYTPVDDTLIPSGKIDPVQDTPLDFTKPHTIGERIDQLKPNPGGYDHNFVLDSQGKKLALAARVFDPSTGRVMEVFTTQPGVQLYTGNFMDGKTRGKGGVVYPKHGGLCLETQHFPDSVHHENFPSVILRPGQTFKQTTVFKFSVK